MTGNHTLCIDCKHVNSKGEIWYDNYCHHHDGKKIEIDPVFGTEEVRWPYCRDINDLRCERFEKEPRFWDKVRGNSL